MRRILRIRRISTAAAVGAVLLGLAPPASAGSIQQPGLTTGLAEGYGNTPGLYSATMLNFGLRTTDPLTTQTVLIPMFVTWSTPLDIGTAHVSLKAAPLVGVSLDAPGLQETNVYLPYASVWFSWFLGNGFNLSLGEGAQLGVGNDLTRAIGRDFVAFQQNAALSYVKNNWNATANAFYTSGRTRDTGSQPHTFNLDLTASKRSLRREYGVVAFGQWDLNSPAVGYLPEGQKQSQLAVGGLFGYIVGNLVMVQAKLTTDIYQKNYGGHDTRLWLQVVLPVWTPRAPTPRNAP